jgi:hypothetical protein
MAPRIRTAKTRAQRIDMQYFARSHPFRRWRLLLSVAAPAAALLWLAGLAAAGSRAPYASGPVAQAHAVFGQRCERCHATAVRAYRSHVADDGCLACHDAPAHKSNQAFTPSCASCHRDHRGDVRLASVDERSCEQCHASLKTTDGRQTVAASVGAFGDRHPEFAARRPGAIDRTALRFNHAVHMKADLRGPGGLAPLACETCHAPAGPEGRTAGAGLMAKVSYARHCAPCHPLFFDPLIDRQAPHERTDVAHDAVVRSLSDFIAAHPDQIRRADPVRGRIPVNFPEPFPMTAGTAAEWLAKRIDVVERLLWNKTCAECHVLERTAQSPVPREVPTNIPSVWMPHARFDHRPHRFTACATCHPARESRETADVLVPSIATCRQCHTRQNGAESRCFECHRYHGGAGAQPSRGGFALRQLLN